MPENPCATIVIHHGYGGSILSPVIERLSKVFCESNVVTVLPNTTDCLNDSGGNIERFTFSKHAADLGAVVGWTKEQNWFHPRLQLAGYSLGGFSAIIQAARNPDVDMLYLVAPIFSGRFFKEGIEKGTPGIMAHWKSNGGLGFTNDQGCSFTAPYDCWNEWIKADAGGAAKNFHGRVSLVTAGEDSLVQPAHIAAMKTAFAAAAFTATRIDGEDHFFGKRAGVLENWAREARTPRI